MNVLIRAFQGVFADRRYGLGAGGSFAGLLGIYLMVLPSSYTGGRIGPRALQFLTLEHAIFATLMAGLMAALLPMAVFLFRRERRPGVAAATGGFMASVLTPLLCCSPLVPTLVGGAAALAPFLSTRSGLALQWFVATYETEVYAGIVLVLAGALYQNARRVAECPACKSSPESRDKRAQAT